MRQNKRVTQQFNNIQPDDRHRRLSVMVVFAAVVVLGGCAGNAPQIPKLSEINPFAEKAPPPLKGKRISVLPQKSASNTFDLAASRPVTLPLPVQNASWSQPGGTPSNAPGHLLLGPTLKRAWSQNVGSGSSSYGRLTTSPIVFGGRVFTLDAAAKLTSFSLASGGPVWRLDLTPKKESSTEGYGGGLAIDAGRLYAATGFGKVLALEPTTGRLIWERNLGIPVRTSPTAAQNKLFVITSSGRFFCLNGQTGEVIWDYRGPSETTQISSNPSPAISGNVVTVPYSNGDLVALDIGTGRPLWSDSLARTRSA
ncbi:MAG: PQQ-binding-like beta-propeller repeat protein, partial [Hyphomicrobiaceae bacterium]